MWRIGSVNHTPEHEPSLPREPYFIVGSVVHPLGLDLEAPAAAGPDGHRMLHQSPFHERGVEAETLACGTGAVAASCALVEWGLVQHPVTIWTRSGRRLEVEAKRMNDGTYDEVWLSGEARLVFRGVIN